MDQSIARTGKHRPVAGGQYNGTCPLQMCNSLPSDISAAQAESKMLTATYVLLVLKHVRSQTRMSFPKSCAAFPLSGMALLAKLRMSVQFPHLKLPIKAAQSPGGESKVW